MADDLDAARSADAVVTLPGAEEFPEPIYAALYGVPVVTLADVLAGPVSAAVKPALLATKDLGKNNGR
ncbi:hypothetical protein AB0J20_19155 [Micromonospora costi]|uniref:hypothetical protein n=1 Tax=Micromonospora costi TaxID=1530042 RepID=UPI0033F3A8F2